MGNFDKRIPHETKLLFKNIIFSIYIFVGALRKKDIIGTSSKRWTH